MENCKVYYCPRGCRIAYRTDDVVVFNNICERCNKKLTWARGDNIKVESIIDIPIEEWIDLR